MPRLLSACRFAQSSFLIALYFIATCRLSFCLYQDQVGKFDWHKQFIGIPKFVYQQSDNDNLIVGTESDVVAALDHEDGSIIWRQLMPQGCHLDHMSILKSSDDSRNYLIRTICHEDKQSNSTFTWDPYNGLLASESRLTSMIEDESAESILTNQGHQVENLKAFTISDEVSLVVFQDGKVTYEVESKPRWIREESLASVSVVEIIQLPSELRDRFGLKKVIVLVTNIGKVFGLDTITGDVTWDLYDEKISTRGQSSHATLIVSRQSDDDIQQSRALIVHPKGYILEINPLNGVVIGRKQLPSKLKQIALTDLDPLDNSRGLILLDITNKVHVYPETIIERVKNNIDKYYLTIANRSPSNIEGFKFAIEADSIVPKLVWTFPISGSEAIVNLQIKKMDEEVHSPARVLGDRGILYKYVNPNLIAVMTQGTTGTACNPDHYINIYLIDGVTGALVYTAHHTKSRTPSNMVHSENWMVYSYYNMKTRRSEISSLEMFEGSVQSNSSTFSSLTKSSIKPKLVEHKSFIFPAGIDAMVDTVTLRGMTNRHIIVALPSGALLEIPKIFLDPRRPINMLMEHREEGLIPYMPELPVPSESMINYNQTLLAIRKIITSPASLESTSLVFAFGLDLFFTRVTPSKTFDILKDDFDHVLIAGALIFLIVASYVSKLLAQRKALRAAWK